MFWPMMSIASWAVVSAERPVEKSAMASPPRLNQASIDRSPGSAGPAVFSPGRFSVREIDEELLHEPQGMPDEQMVRLIDSIHFACQALQTHTLLLQLGSCSQRRPLNQRRA